MGVDKAWRYLSVDTGISCIPPRAKGWHIFGVNPLSTGDFVHLYHGRLVLRLDVETESFYVTDLPVKYGVASFRSRGLFPWLGSHLSARIGRPKDVKRGELTKLEVDLSAHRRVRTQVSFVGIFWPVGFFKCEVICEAGLVPRGRAWFHGVEPVIMVNSVL